MLTGPTFASGAEARVLALDARSGLVRWQAQNRQGNRASLALNQRGDLTATATEVPGGHAGMLEVVLRRTKDGRVLWRRQLTEPNMHVLYGGMAFRDKHLITAGELQEVVTEPVKVPAREVKAFATTHDIAGRELWRTTLPAPAGAATADRVTVSGDRIYISGQQDDRPLVQVGPQHGSSMLWRVHPTSGQVLWTGVTRGTGDPDTWDIGQRTVGVNIDRDRVWELVRHRDPSLGGGTAATAFLLQAWEH